jgi:hypothetical protein
MPVEPLASDGLLAHVTTVPDNTGVYRCDYPPGTFERVSFADALYGRVAPQSLAGKIVLVGVNASALRDAIVTPFDPGLTAPELTILMNEFFSAMTDVVLARRGMLDKYIGDSLMAMFGAPLPDPDHALNACRAALDMRAALASLHSRWRSEGRPCLEMRIGINTRPMVIGQYGYRAPPQLYGDWR